MRSLLVLLVGSAAAAAAGGRDSVWAQRRLDLRRTIFGSTTLPTRSRPDAIDDVVDCRDAPASCAASGGVSASAGIQRITWNISHGYFPLTSTTYRVPVRKGRQSDSIMLHHHGHSASCMNWSSAAWPDPYWGRWGCPRERFWDYYNVSTFIHERLGMDYVMLYMPLLGINTQSGPECVGRKCVPGNLLPHCVRQNTTACHNWLRQWETKGDRTIGYYLEPVHLTINYALTVLGYKHVYMMGLSGGGWTTTLAAALDPRIEVSFPIAGSTPLSITGPTYWDVIGDYEQRPQPSDPSWFLSACNYTCMYLLAGLGAAPDIAADPSRERQLLLPRARHPREYHALRGRDRRRARGRGQPRRVRHRRR